MLTDWKNCSTNPRFIPDVWRAPARPAFPTPEGASHHTPQRILPTDVFSPFAFPCPPPCDALPAPAYITPSGLVITIVTTLYNHSIPSGLVEPRRGAMIVTTKSSAYENPEGMAYAVHTNCNHGLQKLALSLLKGFPILRQSRETSDSAKAKV